MVAGSGLREDRVRDEGCLNGDYYVRNISLLKRKLQFIIHE